MEFILHNFLYILVVIFWFYTVFIAFYTSSKITKFKENRKFWIIIQIALNPYLLIYFLLSNKQRGALSSPEKKLIILVTIGYFSFIMCPFILDAFLQ